MTSHSYIPRIIDQRLDDLLKTRAAVMMLGPRAAGKTETLMRRAKGIVRLDRSGEAAAFHADADAALAAYDKPILLDEWQEVPQVLGAVRSAVNADYSPGNYLVTGSVRADQQHPYWQVTGRIAKTNIYPMTVSEKRKRLHDRSFFDRILSNDPLNASSDSPDIADYLDLVLESGYPYPALALTGRDRVEWMREYIDTMLTHDVQMLSDSQRSYDSRKLKRYFQAYSLMSAGLSEHSTIFTAASLNKITANSYEELLQDLFLVEQIPAWQNNRLKRLIQSPKRYLVEPAFIPALAGMNRDALIKASDLRGRIIDTFVLAQLRPEMSIAECNPTLYHLRTKNTQREVDLIAEMETGEIIAMEVKAGAAPDTADAKHLIWLRDELKQQFKCGIVFHTGPVTYEISRNIIAVPISAMWK